LTASNAVVILMPRGRQSEMILDEVFRTAKIAGRTLRAAELMSAIGLSRTSIYGSYSHVIPRLKAHNVAVLSELEGRSVGNAGDSRAITSTPKQINARLRREAQAAKDLAENYAEQIRRLTLENYFLKHGDPHVVDGRGRFGAETADR
jgi:hypothetical protein